MATNPINSRGFLICTRQPLPGQAWGHHRLGGQRGDYPDFEPPTCHGCRQPVPLLFRIDFDDPPLAELQLWEGVLYGMLCFNCQAEGEPPLFWWDYSDANKPQLLEQTSLDVFDDARYEYELTPIYLKPFSLPLVHPHYRHSRVGGHPRFVQPVTTPDCIHCGKSMHFLLQFTDSFDYRPRQTHPSAPGGELVDELMHFWFGCSECRVVATLEQEP